MEYKQFEVIDLGYALVDGDLPLSEISGLDNRNELQFYHRGYEGVPDISAAVVHLIVDAPGKMLFCFDGELPGGTPVPVEGVPALLTVDYGWPADTTMGADGLPVVAE